VVAVDAAFAEAFAEYADEHDISDDYAEPHAGGSLPPRPEVVAESLPRKGKTDPRRILERVALCKTTVTFEYVRPSHYPEENPLQVTILRFWLERLAPCVMDWGDFAVELGEDVLARLRKMKSKGTLGHVPPAKKKPVRRRVARPGEVRSVRILQRLEVARADPDLAVDLGRALAKLSAPAERYLTLLLEEGAVDDSKAMRALEVDAATLAAIAEEIEAVVCN
jgi:hypothetical protein